METKRNCQFTAILCLLFKLVIRKNLDGNQNINSRLHCFDITPIIVVNCESEKNTLNSYGSTIKNMGSMDDKLDRGLQGKSGGLQSKGVSDSTTMMMISSQTHEPGPQSTQPSLFQIYSFFSAEFSVPK